VLAREDAPSALGASDRNPQAGRECRHRAVIPLTRRGPQAQCLQGVRLLACAAQQFVEARSAMRRGACQPSILPSTPRHIAANSVTLDNGKRRARVPLNFNRPTR
jgi:hypothetical protein